MYYNYAFGLLCILYDVFLSYLSRSVVTYYVQRILNPVPTQALTQVTRPSHMMRFTKRKILTKKCVESKRKGSGDGGELDCLGCYVLSHAIVSWSRGIVKRGIHTQSKEYKDGEEGR